MKKEMTNLQRLLAFKGISTKTVQGVIGARSEKTAYEKINLIRDFKLPEAVALKNSCFPEYDFDYLFKGYDKAAETED